MKPEDFGIFLYDQKTFNEKKILNCWQDVNLSNRQLEKIPFKFGHVQGNFDCHSNKITSFENSPYSVTGNFNFRENQITSFKNCPRTIGGNFEASFNKLSSFNYYPESVKGFHLFLGSKFIHTVDEWIFYLEKHEKFYLYCHIVEGHDREQILKNLKAKKTILELIK